MAASSFKRQAICAAEPKPEDQEIRIILIGERGAGKSAAGNTILGKEVFPVGQKTESCQLGIRAWKAKRVVVVDTPAVSDFEDEESQICTEIRRSYHLARPGPHALVFVVPLENSREAYERATSSVQKVFGQEAVNYILLLLTGKDRLASRAQCEHPPNQDRKGHVDRIQKARGQYVVFNNKETGTNRSSQAEDLLIEIKQMVQDKSNAPFCILEAGKHLEQTPEKTQGLEKPELEEEATEHQERKRTDTGEGPSSAHQPARAANVARAVPGKPGSVSGGTQEPELRIILVGKSGGGKSAIGNTILGEKWFESRFAPSSVTKACQLGIREWKGKRIVVVDTPPFFDSHEIWNFTEIQRCLSLSGPNPRVLVLVIQVTRFTEEDQQMVERVKRKFGNEAQNYMIIAFTHTENLSGTLEEYVNNSGNEQFEALIKACSNRYCGFNNRETGEKQAEQAEGLLSRTEEMFQESQK